MSGRMGRMGIIELGYFSCMYTTLHCIQNPIEKLSGQLLACCLLLVYLSIYLSIYLGGVCVYYILHVLG